MKKLFKTKSATITAILMAMALMTGCGDISLFNFASAEDTKEVDEDDRDKKDDEEEDDKDKDKAKDKDKDKDDDDDEVMYDDEAETHVMPGVLAEITHSNWGLVGGSYWSYTSYSVNYDKTLEITDCWVEDGRELIGTAIVDIEDEDFDKLEKSLKKVRPKHSSTNGADGDAWRVAVYDENGDITNSMPMGYIYGESLFEKKIIPTLEKYKNGAATTLTTEDDTTGGQSAGTGNEEHGSLSDNTNVYFSLIVSYVTETTTSQYGGVNHIFTVHHDGSVISQVFEPDGTEERLEFYLTSEQMDNLKICVDQLLEQGEITPASDAAAYYAYDICDEDENVLLSAMADGTCVDATQADYVLLDAYLAAWLKAKDY